MPAPFTSQGSGVAMSVRSEMKTFTLEAPKRAR